MVCYGRRWFTYWPVLVLSVRYDPALVGLVRLISVVTSTFLMDKAGRKALLYTSSMLMFLSMLTLTINSHTTVCSSCTVPPNVTASLHDSSGGGCGDPARVIPLIGIMVFIFGELNPSCPFFKMYD